MKRLIALITFASFFTALPAASGSTDTTDYIAAGSKFIQEKKYEEAIDSYRKALKINPEDAKAKILLGLTYAEIGDFENAIDYTQQVALSMPDSYTAIYNLGLIYGAANKLEEALHAFDRAVDLNPESFMAVYQQGLIYLASNDYDLAIASFRKALRLNPYFDDARISLVGAFLKIDNRNEAMAQIEEFRKMKKDEFVIALEERMKGA